MLGYVVEEPWAALRITQLSEDVRRRETDMSKKEETRAVFDDVWNLNGWLKMLNRVD